MTSGDEIALFGLRIEFDLHEPIDFEIIVVHSLVALCAKLEDDIRITDMRMGMNTLARQLQEGLGRDPHAGEIFCFRGRRGDLIKILWHDGVGMSLYLKRREAGKFIWPSSGSGDEVEISAAHGYLPEGVAATAEGTAAARPPTRGGPLLCLRITRKRHPLAPPSRRG